MLGKILSRLRGKGEGPPTHPAGGKPSKYDGMADQDLIANRGANVGRPPKDVGGSFEVHINPNGW